MKKLVFTVAVSTLLAACLSTTAPSNAMFGANANSNVTVSQAKSMADDMRVTLEGKIVRQVRGEHYIFTDSTGEIEVEIDHHVWNGLTVSSADTIRIQGEIDKEAFSTNINVKYVEKVQ